MFMKNWNTVSCSHSGEAPLGYNEEGVRFEDLPKSRVFAEIAVRLGQAFDIGNLAAGRTFADLLTLGPTVHVTHVPIKVYFQHYSESLRTMVKFLVTAVVAPGVYVVGKGPFEITSIS